MILMKKLIALCSAFITVFAFTSCGRDDTYNTDNNGNVSQNDSTVTENSLTQIVTQSVTRRTDAGDYVNDVVDGVQNAGEEIIDGAGDAVKDIVDGVNPKKDVNETHTETNT